ncbi:hypothetical protein DL96DRAFT_1583758 [Flagelloscypha sp. PMI_526]|nr:hypothetical protein DL96DRAFT_1583758 [Flagelloscypha sp. PMI_526]
MSVIVPSKNLTVPSWPGLYNPGIEWLPIDGVGPVQEKGKYLYASDDVFRFVLYWTLVCYMPIFAACGFYAFANLTFRPKRPYPVPLQHLHLQDLSDMSTSTSVYPLSPITPTSPGNTNASLLRHPASPALTPQPKQNELRSRITFAVLVFIMFIALGLAGTFISSAIIGIIIWAVFDSVGYYVSTWVPFLFAILHVFFGILSIYPSVIDIM